jgi:carboxymethylenebutenolidase
MKQLSFLFLCTFIMVCHTVTAQNIFSKAKKANAKPVNTKLGHMVSFVAPDSSKGQAFHIPASRRSEKALLLIHEWWSLNSAIDIHIQKEAKRWQELLGDIDVYVLDLYDSRVAASLQEAQRLSVNLDPKRGENLIKGVINHIGQDRPVAIVGYCTGGTWAFNAATIAGTQIAGCVMYYAEPAKNPYQIRDLHSDVFYVWATKDRHVTKAALGTFKKRVEGTGHTFQVYATDNDHAFANPQNSMYDQEAAMKAEKAVLGFLKEKLFKEQPIIVVN